MIIIYSKEDVKTLILKYALLNKEVSFVSCKMKKSERDRINNELDFLGETHIIDTLKTIEDEHEENYNKKEYPPTTSKLNKLIDKKVENKSLKIDDILISLRYLDDKCSTPYFYPYDFVKRYQLKQIENKFYKDFVEIYFKIEEQILNIIGVETFYKIHSRGIAKKKIKEVKNIKEIELINSYFKKNLIPSISNRTEKKHLFFNYLTIPDIFIYSIYYRMNLFGILDLNLFSIELKNKFETIFNSHNFKKASLNKCHRNIVK